LYDFCQKSTKKCKKTQKTAKNKFSPPITPIFNNPQNKKPHLNPKNRHPLRRIPQLFIINYSLFIVCLGNLGKIERLCRKHDLLPKKQNIIAQRFHNYSLFIINYKIFLVFTPLKTRIRAVLLLDGPSILTQNCPFKPT